MKYVMEITENSPQIKVFPEETGPIKGRTKYYTSIDEASDAVLELNRREEAKSALADDATTKAKVAVAEAKSVPQEKPKTKLSDKFKSKLKG